MEVPALTVLAVLAAWTRAAVPVKRPAIAAPTIIVFEVIFITFVFLLLWLDPISAACDCPRCNESYSYYAAGLNFWMQKNLTIAIQLPGGRGLLISLIGCI
jgi:hypothetical protein